MTGLRVCAAEVKVVIFFDDKLSKLEIQHEPGVQLLMLQEKFTLKLMLILGIKNISYKISLCFLESNSNDIESIKDFVGCVNY